MEVLDGTVTNVWGEDEGTELAVDAAAGSSVFYVVDVSSFEEGKRMVLGTNTLVVQTIDPDAGTLKTTAPSIASAVAGDDIWPLPRGYTRYAMVTLDDAGPGITAVVPPRFHDDLDTGIRNPDDQEAVTVTSSHGNWRITDLHNQAKASLKFESDDVHAVTQYDINLGYVDLFLSHKPIKESTKLWWRTVAQQPTEYTVDEDGGTIHMSLDTTYVQVGDAIWPHYAYRYELDEEPVSWSVIASRGQNGGYASSPTTSFALPSPGGGLLPTDLIVFAQIGGFGTGAQYAVTDHRLYAAGETTCGGRPCGLYVGYVGDGSPIQATLSGGDNAFGQFADNACIILRGDNRRLYFDPDRVGVSPDGPGDSGVIPSLPGKGSGSVCVVFASGGVGGAYGFDWSESAPYSYVFGQDQSYDVINFGTLHADDAVSATNPTDDPGDYTAAIAVGLRYAR